MASTPSTGRRSARIFHDIIIESFMLSLYIWLLSQASPAAQKSSNTMVVDGNITLQCPIQHRDDRYRIFSDLHNTHPSVFTPTSFLSLSFSQSLPKFTSFTNSNTSPSSQKSTDNRFGRRLPLQLSSLSFNAVYEFNSRALLGVGIF